MTMKLIITNRGQGRSRSTTDTSLFVILLRSRRAFRADALQQNRRRLVVRVLIDQLALEGPLEDGLAKASASTKLNRDDCGRFVHNTNVTLELLDQSLLVMLRR